MLNFKTLILHIANLNYNLIDFLNLDSYQTAIFRLRLLNVAFSVDLINFDSVRKAVKPYSVLSQPLIVTI